LQQRINAFSARIEKALKENWDEILVVGHSSGAHIAISGLAQIERSVAFDQAPAKAVAEPQVLSQERVLIIAMAAQSHIIL
jgi:alpha-beta hydrolase superfamily lysophospholipase